MDSLDVSQSTACQTPHIPIVHMTSSQSSFRSFGFSVPYNIQFHQTDDCFHPDNDLLLQLMQVCESKACESVKESASSSHQAPPIKWLCAIDSGVVDYRPDIISQITRWQSTRPTCQLVLDPLVIAGGELAKRDMSVVQRIIEACEAGHICRHSYVVVIGGGAVLDAVGLGAALTHRGVRLIRLPSTTLGQADAGLGVKNGINALGHKNFIGTFAPPYAVINDHSFLTHAPERARRDGIIEAIKVALIKDGPWYEQLCDGLARKSAQGDLAALRDIIYHSAVLHLEHICQGGDPFEMGSSRPLDFGHWLAHRLEILSRHRLSHGEAVAIGVAYDCCYAALTPLALTTPTTSATAQAQATTLLPNSEPARLIKVLLQCGFPLRSLAHRSRCLAAPQTRYRAVSRTSRWRFMYRHATGHWSTM